MNYNEKSNKADDVDSMLAETFEAGILQGPDADARFHESLESAGDMTAKDYGEEMERHTLEAGAELIITRVNLASASEELRALHSRMQPLLLFFVDGASGIDSQDPAWDLLVALRESKGSLQVVLLPP